MPRKRKITNNVVIQRPQRNMRAKKVFDPSDNYLPKKRNNYSVRTVKPIESNNVKKRKCTKKKNQKTKSNNNLVNYSSESRDENIFSLIHSPSPSSSPITTTEIPERITTYCFLCTEITDEDLIDCPVCLVKVHKDCLVIDEPMWKFKLDLCSWLCESCRESHCSQCLQNDTEMELLSCVTCKVGLHFDCYDSCDIKPLQKIKDLDIFVCIPCLTLATQKLPEEEEEEGWKEIEVMEMENKEESIEDEIEMVQNESEQEDEENENEEIENEVMEEESEEDIDYIYASSIDEINTCDDNGSYKLDKTDDSSLDSDKDFTEGSYKYIPNVTRWSKYQVYEYFADRLPKEILVKIIKNVRYYY